MNKEEIEKAMEVVFNETCKECYFPKKRKCTNCIKENGKKIKAYIKHLEQKESILDKVTDKLKEDIKIFGNHEERKQMCKEQLYENDGKWFHAKEILNIIEGEKK